MKFCENCNELTEATVCPKCGKPTRQPQDGDLCFVEEFGNMGCGMFTDALSSSNIKSVVSPVHGGFSRLNTPKSYKVYVRYADYDTAIEILNILFGEQENAKTANLDDPADIIGRIVSVTIDRPVDTVHPTHADIIYKQNYGHVEGVMGGDGEEQDAYILDCPRFLSHRGRTIDGYVVAVIVRKDDVETKWVVAPMFNGKALSTVKYTREQIAQAVHFQEQYFDIEIIM